LGSIYIYYIINLGSRHSVVSQQIENKNENNPNDTVWVHLT